MGLGLERKKEIEKCVVIDNLDGDTTSSIYADKMRENKLRHIKQL